MDTSDDDDNHEELDLLVKDIVSTSQATPQPKKKLKTGRGPGKSVKSSEPMLLEFDELNFPTGDWEWKYGQHVGRCALRIDINFRKWSVVDQEVKDTLWVETQKLFHIHDPKGLRKKNFLRALAARFRILKSRLVSRFIEKKNAPDEGNPNANREPWEVYAGYITEDQWNSFKEYVNSEEFKKRSQLGKKCSKGNIHRHTLGQKSYSRKRAEWIKEKRLPPPSECSTSESTLMNERFEKRALEWCLAHQKRSRDGKWEVDPKNPETARVVNQVMENLEKEANEKEEGVACSSEQGVDALSKAIGKKDHHGYVKGLARFGVGVGYRQVFGKLARQGRISTEIEQIEALKATLTQEFAREKATLTEDFAREKAQLTQEFEVRLQERVATEVQAYIVKLPSLDMPTSRFLSSPGAPQPLTIEEPKKCRLAVNDEHGNLVVVADGRAYHIHASVMHSSFVLPNHYKVSINNPFEEHESVLLPVPSDDGVTELGKAKNCIVQWPKSMVLFEEQALQPFGHNKMIKSKSKERVASCDSGTEESDLGAHQHTIMDLCEGLTEECEMLQLVMIDDNHDNIRVPLKASLLHFQEGKDVWVTSAEISKFIRGTCLNASLIHVYILWLVEEFISGMKGRSISFLCPQRISGAECKRSFLEVLAYVKQAFWSELQKKEAHCKFILFPYNEDNHWILMAIDLRAGVVFQFDPFAQQHPRELSCDSVFQYAYKSYRSRIKARDMPNSNSKLVVKKMECPQQIDVIECGYYVMRYMYEIVTLHSECKGDLQQEYIGRSNPYTESEMAEVRDQWARFFRESFLLT